MGTKIDYVSTVIVPVGLPGSGKTSFIRKHRANLTVPSVVISGDQIRLMLHLGEYHYSEEDTKDIRCAMVEMSRMFLKRYDVIYLDEFYLANTVAERSWLVAVFNSFYIGVNVEFHGMTRSLGGCIHRRCTDDREPDTARWPQVLLDLSKTFEPLIC